MFKPKTPRRESKYKVTIRSVVLETVNGRLEMRMVAISHWMRGYRTGSSRCT